MRVWLVRMFGMFGARLRGGHVGVVLAGIVLITFILPPAAAWSLNSYRIRVTTQRVTAVATYLRNSGGPTSIGLDIPVVCGPGRIPDRGPTGEWVSRAVQVPNAYGPLDHTDGWGRCLLVNVENLSSESPVWVMSAGPNGVIETYPDAPTLNRDDIGARIQ